MPVHKLPVPAAPEVGRVCWRCGERKPYAAFEGKARVCRGCPTAKAAPKVRRRCAVCGAAFVARSGRALGCSTDCRRALATLRKRRYRASLHDQAGERARRKDP